MNRKDLFFSFDKNPVGAFPNRWSSQKTAKRGLRSSSVIAYPTAPSQPNVFAQTSQEYTGYHFNVALQRLISICDLDVYMVRKIRCVPCALSYADNYYICRVNPLRK